MVSFPPPGDEINRLLDVTISSRTSDLHLAVGSLPKFRHGADLVSAEGFDVVSETFAAAFVSRVADALNLDTWEGDYDGGYEYGGSRFRVNVAKQRGTLRVVLRTIPLTVPEFHTLGLPPAIEKFSEFPTGLVLVCGPTGSGKSTTLASLLDKINRQHSGHIITIEDPVEFTHESKRCLVTHREVGKDTASFATGLRSSLRQDPDVILVGELRDLETISLAVTAAETGHLTLATVHASTAKSTVDRLIDVFPAGQQGQIRAQLANTLKAVICQSRFSRVDKPGSSVVVCEVMVVTTAIASMIREGEVHRIDSAIQSGVRQHDMQPFDLGLARAVMAGHLDTATGARNAHSESDFHEYLKTTR
jgi:twitching motility protein PilT